MPRPVKEQVVVITGASSGIGRATAIEFGKQGASVVLAARDESALQEVAAEIDRLGGRSYTVVTDVAVWEQVDRLATEAIGHFGRVDAWINNAAVSAYGTVDDMTVDELERVIQVNLLGQMYGVKAILPHFRARRQGTIINVASGLADRAVPLQAAYCASKSGIKGFTEALRMELDYEQSGIVVTLALPASINTPLFTHARSRMGVKPQPLPPIYEPPVAAEALVFAAEHPQRDVYIGGASKLMSIMQRISPALLDRYMVQGGRAFKQQQTTIPDDGKDNLNRPMPGTDAATGDCGPVSKPESLYTSKLGVYPKREYAVTGAALAGLMMLVRRLGR
jgi:short-subunit dehydrogenase